MSASEFSSPAGRVLFFSGIGTVFVCFVLFWTLMRPHSAGPEKPVEERCYANGELRSRTEIVDGVPDGLSQGWFTNGQLQVAEYYTHGVSHGLRTQWYITGEKKSEAEIVRGQIHGRFRRWYKNGQLAEDAGFSNGIPHGISYAWYEDGAKKAEVLMENGVVVKQQFWDEYGGTVLK
ncbi:toxin-antitoxin system YwqK family antitoxin [Verrucomicrobia bacterium S94]|nr:toxin-antitoxin system YwqK family antitoxin [Verrucomicrobia bacterium S94]